jgi:hypothetical protein
MGKIVLLSMGDRNTNLHHHNCLLLIFEKGRKMGTMAQWEDKTIT